MANYYVPMAAPNVGGGLNFEPINAALDSVIQQKNTNRAAQFQQQQFDANQQQRQFENSRAIKQDQNAEIKMFGDRAKAYAQLPPDDPMRQNWSSLVKARHPNAANLDPRYLDPVEGPKLVMAEAGEYLDPRDSQAKDLALQETRAKINKLNIEAQNGGSAFGKAGTIVQGSDGSFYSIQFGSGGQRKIEKLELGAPTQPSVGAGASGAVVSPSGVGENGEPVQRPAPIPLTPSRGVKVEGDLMYDAATGKTVRNVGSNIAEGARQTVVGRETGEGQMNLPKRKAALASAAITDNIVYDAIGQARDLAKKSFTTGFSGAMTSNVPGTPGYDLGAIIDTIGSNLGFDKLQDMRNNSPTGGALGSVSDVEGRLLRSTLVSLSQSQSQEQFLSNLDKLENYRRQFADERRRAYEEDVARFGAANVPNPETGKMPGGEAPASPQGGAPDWRNSFKRVD